MIQRTNALMRKPNQTEREICTGPLQFGLGGIQLEDLFLVELRHVSKSSFQPILAIESARVPPAFFGQPLWPASEFLISSGESYLANSYPEGDSDDIVDGGNLDF
jgi:hypothetical protein